MKRAKIADAKNNLSRYLRYVRAGGRVRIFDRDTPVADLVPVEPDPGEEDDEALLEALVARGIVKRGEKGPLPKELRRPGPRLRRGSLSEEIRRDRDAR